MLPFPGAWQLNRCTPILLREDFGLSEYLAGNRGWYQESAANDGALERGLPELPSDCSRIETGRPNARIA